MEWANKGAAALAGTDQALAAVTYYTKALIEHPTSPDYLTQRAAGFSRLRPPRHDLALHDAEYAILLGQKRGKREKIQAAQQRRVVALYGLERYGEAKQVLDYMLKWRVKDSKKDKMEHDMWMAKLNSKLKDKETSDQTCKEYPEIALPDDKTMKNWIQGQLKADGSFRFDGEADETQPAALVAETMKEDFLAATQPASATPTQTKSIQPIRHDFFQNNDNLIVTFYAKKVDPAKLDYKLDSNSVSLSFPHPEAHENSFSYTASPTFAALDTSNSTHKVFGTKIELILAKQEKGLKWPALEAQDKPALTKLPSPYVTKSKDDGDWDKRAAEITKKEPKKKKEVSETSEEQSDHEDGMDADSDEGGDAVDGFFKKLYKGADDDTRKAMMKSFQESNGTALSTNWSEVSKGRVEVAKSKDER